MGDDGLFDVEDQQKARTDSVDLSSDTSLVVDISDALSERDKVKFTVHTKIPPPPPKPDFDASREKLQKLGEGEGTMTKEEFQKMKAELEAEYLATFKKTVAMHEVFLQRLAAHPTLRTDHNFRVFLEYKQALDVRGRNKKEKFGSLVKLVTKSVDEVLVTGQKDVDPFFERERTFVVEYHNKVKDSTARSDRMTRSNKQIADTYIRVSSGLNALATLEKSDLDNAEAIPESARFFIKVSEMFEKLRKVEARVATDADLKLSDLLRYYMRDTAAAKDLLYRRMRSLVNYQNANKALEKARAKNKEVQQAEKNQEEACNKFEKLSEVAKQELTDYKTRRVAAFKKNLVELAELEVKHAKTQVQLLRNTIATLKEETP
ncbi:putative sorting nexin-6 isoform X2 [Apostichopus japonicus]|uniref:Putative sorting nexin-6 isoform X2 n=1 Tax=Stichopus japonicus TaxID=307972 RepID=A0A2G8KP26_STIJA|nr:putative sorting nexin-6 isoform X2 [Apostichopus japonicus]